MMKYIYKFSLILIFFYSGLSIFAQQKNLAESGLSVAAPKKYALVIGNSNYTGLTKLTNPVNDANDIGAVLEHLGFSVEKVLNGNLEQMENAILRLRDRLSAAKNSYGFFFYAGHGVQFNGDNYLIPVGAVIPNENRLKNQAVSVQSLLDDLNDAGNGLNVVVLDACRDNPFGWSRSGSRGLAIVSSQPADSIIVYATSAGQKASDGEGRNGLFTSQLINNLATPGLEVKEIFNRTGADVAEKSKRQQIPAVYNQFFGTAYLGEAPDSSVLVQRLPGTSPYPWNDTKHQTDKGKKLWSIGASVGTGFYEPLVTGIIRGTISPFKYSFFEFGFNAGFLSIRKNTESFYSLAPYMNAAFFMPFNNVVSGYFFTGIEYKISNYEYYGLKIPVSSLPINAGIGLLLLDFLDISYTLSYPLWIDCDSTTTVGKALLNNVNRKINNKFSVGYVYRFR